MSRINKRYEPEGEPPVNVTIHFSEAGHPFCAEVYSDDQRDYTDVGLEMDGQALDGYDGCYALPVQVCQLLLEHGYTISENVMTEELRQKLAEK